MPLSTYQQLPPRVQAVQFDGTNAAEIAVIMGVDTPAVQTDGSGRSFINLPMPFNVTGLFLFAGDHLVIDGWNKYGLSDADFTAQYAPVA